MGKTYRREKNVWDDDPLRFENRSNKKKPKKSFKDESIQELRKNKNKNVEEFFSYEKE